MFLDTTQHEWLQNHMQSSKLRFIQLRIALCVTFDIFRKPFTKFVVGVKKSWHDEMQKGPKFLHIVLNRGSGKKQSVSAMESQQRLPAGTRRTLDSLCLVQNHVLPSYALKVLSVRDDKLVRGNEDMEWCIFAICKMLSIPKLTQHFTVLSISPIRQHFELRNESCNFLLPIVKCGSWSDNQERP